ncbi:hypothetical protein NUSPORA_02199 [Nucleospora cyclopteri]
MGRMHSAGKGHSIAMKPFKTVPPTFLNKPIGDIEKMIIAQAKKGVPISTIGTNMRDIHGIGNIQDILGCTLLAFLKKNNAAPAIPEDLNCLIEKAAEIRMHLVVHRKDNDAKYRLNLVNSRLHRLLRYHVQKGNLPKNFKPKKN